MKEPNQDRTATKKYNYTGKNVHIGLDVHKTSYFLSAKCEGMLVKQVRLPGSPEELLKYLNKTFPGAKLHTAYEAGFCGFYLHRFLVAAGINSIVVHPASIEVSSRDRVKTDKRDSLKIATQLAAGRLRGVNIPSEKQEHRREVTRLREKFIQDRQMIGCQIKSFMFRHQECKWEMEGIMSRKFIQKLGQCKLPFELGIALKALTDEWMYVDTQIKELEKILEKQAKEDPIIHNIIQSTPGIGLLGARIIANELGDMSQFSSAKKLYSFTGLTPSEYSSGDQRRQGHITRQGRSILRKILVQGAWTAIRRDLDLRNKYETIAKRAGGKRAIVAVARILIGRIRACLNKTENYLITEKV